MTNETYAKDITDEKPDNLSLKDDNFLNLNGSQERYKEKSASSRECLSLYAAACTFCLIIAIALSLGLGLKTCDKGRVRNS